MRSISSLLKSHIKSAIEVAYPFSEDPQITQTISHNSDYASNIPQILFSKYKKDYEKLWGLHNTPPTPLSFFEEIKVHLKRKEGLEEINNDFNATMLIKLTPEFLEEGLRNIIRHKASYLSPLSSSSVLVIFPFGEILQKMFLNQFRGVTIAETIARIHEYKNNDVVRASCIQNYNHFHGLLIDYLLAQEENEKKQLQNVNFNNLSQFLVEKGLLEENQLKKHGGKVLNSLEGKSWKLFRELTGVAYDDLLYNVNSFLNHGEIKIVDSFHIMQSFKLFLEDLTKKGKVFYNNERGFYLSNEVTFFSNLFDIYKKNEKEKGSQFNG